MADIQVFYVTTDEFDLADEETWMGQARNELADVVPTTDSAPLQGWYWRARFPVGPFDSAAAALEDGQSD